MISADTIGDLLSLARDICVETQAVSLQTEPFSPKLTLTSDGQLLILDLDVIWFEVNENLHCVTVFEMWSSSLGCGCVVVSSELPLCRWQDSRHPLVSAGKSVGNPVQLGSFPPC